MRNKIKFLIIGIFLANLVVTLHPISAQTEPEPPPPGCGELQVINDAVEIPFPLTAVHGVYDAYDFLWDQDFITGQTGTNYYNTTIGSSYENMTGGGSLITGIYLFNETWVVAVVTDDFGKLIAIDDVCVPCETDCNQCGDFQSYQIINGKVWVDQLIDSDSMEAIYEADLFDHDSFWTDPQGYLDSPPNGQINWWNNQVIRNGNELSNVDASLESKFVVIVFRDSGGEIFAFDGTCNGDYQCQDYRDFIVNNGWIDIPPIGSSNPDDPQIEDIELLGVFRHDQFDFGLFDLDPHQYLLDHQAENYNGSATVVKGGVEITDPSLNGQYVVLVVKDLGDPLKDEIMAVDGWCADSPPDGGFPFDSLTFGAGIGDVLEYNIALSGLPTGESAPLFGMMTDTGSEFLVSDGDVLSITVTNLPTLDDLMKEKDTNGEDQGGFGIRGTIVNGDQVGTDTEIFGFILPLEFVQAAAENPSNFSLFGNDNPDDNNTDAEFNPFSRIVRTTEDSVTFGTLEGAEMSFEITIDIESGVATRAEISGTPPDEPVGTDVSLIIELTTDLSTLNPGNTSEPDSTQTITTSNGFEFVGLFLGLVGLLVVNKKKQK
ncbi:MAG: hypothetical protein ACW99A_21910 [Candidatus Kariarchaeaceae archaeon]|jgi:hypothetical protein